MKGEMMSSTSERECGFAQEAGYSRSTTPFLVSEGELAIEWHSKEVMLMGRIGKRVLPWRTQGKLRSIHNPQLAYAGANCG